jgi:hypothetical protein
MDDETPLTAKEFLQAFAEKSDTLADIEDNFNEGLTLEEHEIAYLIGEAKHAANFALTAFLAHISDTVEEPEPAPES